MSPWDTVVVGGGPAGLSAAFWLARYRRRTIILDDDRPRNEAAWAVHGFPGLEDPAPEELRQRLLEQAAGAGALLERRRVAEIEGQKGEFVIRDDQGGETPARRVVLAYGRTDRLPDIAGIRDLYGSSVFHCPDCDGPSVIDQTVGVLGHDQPAAALALYLLTWASRTVLLTNGLEPDITPSAHETLGQYDVAIDDRRVTRVEGTAGALQRVVFEEGEMPLEALFFHWGSDPSSHLAAAAGCDCASSGDIKIDRATMETSTPGVHAAGDIVGRPYLASVAAAEGIRAALAIHRSLLPDEFQL